MSSIAINNQTVQVKKYNGQRVVTFKDIDLVHNRADGTAGRNFRANRKHFIEGEDFFSITPNDFQSDEIRRFGISSPKGGIVVTESGYLMLVKSFTDDLSWNVQRQLVKSYFRGKDEQTEPDPKPYEYFDKTFNGEPVLTSKDVEYLTKINRHTVDWHMRTKLEKGKDFYFAEGDVLRKYKEENPKVSRHVGSCYLVTREGFIKLCSAYGVKIETPKCFENKNPDEHLPMKIITQDTKDTMAEIREEAERLIHLTYLLDDARGTVLCGETYHQSKAAIIRQMKSIGNCVSLVLKFDF